MTFWSVVGHLSEVITVLGLPTLAIYYHQISRNFMAHRRIEATPLDVNSGYKGLICPVSAPPPRSADPQRQPDTINKLIQENKHPPEALLATPLGPVLKAMQLHERDLIYCWLVGSEDSLPYVNAIKAAAAKYFPLVAIRDVAVPDVYCKIDDVYEAVHDIFASCEKATEGKVRPRDIITDVTSGTKIMSIAVAMACLDADRNIQYQEQKEQKSFYKIDITWEKIASRPRSKL
jgi:hypothetical protein